MSKQLVFVYGTLRRDGVQAMAKIFPGSRFIDNASVRGSLYDLGAFPGLLLEKSQSSVTGEVYEVDDEILKQLDAIEAADRYWRKQVEISVGSDSRKCWVYEFDPKFYSARIAITSGDWIEYIGTRSALEARGDGSQR